MTEFVNNYIRIFGIINTTEKDWIGFGAHLHYAFPADRIRR